MPLHVCVVDCSLNGKCVYPEVTHVQKYTRLHLRHSGDQRSYVKIVHGLPPFYPCMKHNGAAYQALPSSSLFYNLHWKRVSLICLGRIYGGGQWYEELGVSRKKMLLIQVCFTHILHWQTTAFPSRHNTTMLTIANTHLPAVQTYLGKEYLHWWPPICWMASHALSCSHPTHTYIQSSSNMQIS